MKLNDKDIDLYFKLTWELQLYAIKKLKLFDDIKTTDDLQEAMSDDKLVIREALYNDTSIIDNFVKENPASLQQEELAIVSSWKKAIIGTFYIERLLKKHAIFISEDNSSQVFAVHALYDSFSEIIYSRQLPMRVGAVLLPFKSIIIYDGLLRGYNIYFGGGTRSRLKENYMRAKQNNRIITTLDEQTITQKKSAKNLQKSYKKEVQQLEKIAKKLRGGASQPVIESPVFSLLKASIGLAQAATEKNVKTRDLWQEYEKIRRALNKTHTIISRRD